MTAGCNAADGPSKSGRRGDAGGGRNSSSRGVLHGMIVLALGSFSSSAGIRCEDDLESEICGHLVREHGYIVKRQVAGGRGHNRYDIVCAHGDAPGEKVCVEVKLKASAADFDQFDRYMGQFHDGLVVACWSATQPVRDVVHEIAGVSPVPVGIVEVGLRHALA